MSTTKSLRASLRRRFILLLYALSITAGPATAGQPPCPALPDLKGAWTEEGGAAQILFETERVVLLEHNSLRAAMVLRREPCTLTVRDRGDRSTWSLNGDLQNPRLDRGKGARRLVPLANVPPSLDITPLPLPPATPVSAEKVKEIAAELWAREGRDQKLAWANQDAERAPLLADNDRYLREVVSQYGWIDIPRFGKPAASVAILIVKHGGDLRLMQSALPIIERDAIENGGGKELVSVLVDAVLIHTGHKQKYGTQLREDSQGRPYVLPVEDPTKVDEYRKALGIKPWSEYLQQASEALYNKAPIRIPTADD